MSTTCPIDPNPDVAGIGVRTRLHSISILFTKRDNFASQVRVNFYFTIILLALVPQMPETEELLNALYANAGLSGLGLFVTAIIHPRLSLFHTIFIFHILFFLGIGAAPMGE
jgi:hypothetical protein